MKLFGSLKEIIAVVFRKSGFEVTLEPKSATAATTFQLPDADGTSGELLDTTHSATVQNKVLDDTNQVNLTDGLFTLTDEGGTDRKAIFQCNLIPDSTTNIYIFPDTNNQVFLTDGSTANVTNKSLDNTNDASLTDSNFTLEGTSANAQFDVDSLTVDRTYTLPNADDTLVGRDTTDTLTNKTLDNTNSITVKDAALTVQDQTDVTKQAVFEASGITTATTRTYTLPDESDTLATENHVASAVSTHDVANDHIDHSGVDIATAAAGGLQGGGDITATRNLSLNVNGLTEDVSPNDAADYLVIYDASEAGADKHKKVLISNLPVGAASSASQLITNDTSIGSVTVSAGKTLFHPYLTVASGHTYIISGRAIIGQSLTVASGGTYTVASGGISLIHTIEN